MPTIEEQRAYNRRYYQEHKEHLKEYGRRYHQEHRERILEQRRIKSQKLKEEREANGIGPCKRPAEDDEERRAARREYHRRYREEHHYERLVYEHEYNRTHAEQRRAYSREYYRAHRDEIRAKQHANREKLREYEAMRRKRRKESDYKGQNVIDTGKIKALAKAGWSVLAIASDVGTTEEKVLEVLKMAAGAKE